MPKDIKQSGLWKWLMEVNSFMFILGSVIIGLISMGVSLLIVWITTRR